MHSTFVLALAMQPHVRFDRLKLQQQRWLVASFVENWRQVSFHDGNWVRMKAVSRCFSHS